MPFESLQTNFSNKIYATFKKNTFIFLSFRSSILKLLYLRNFGLQSYEMYSCGIPMSILSNTTIHTNIGFFDINLCQISHDDVIMDSFSGVNLNEIPCAIVSTC